MRGVAIGFFLAISIGAAFGEDFKNSYIRFSLPTGWSCETEGTAFVCNPPHLNGQPVSAIMIITAKIAGPDDNVTAYFKHLEATAAAIGPNAMKQAPTLTKINGMTWVDCTIEGSEIKNYETRYLAVSANGLAILYTLSAQKDYFGKIIGSAVLAVNTLQMLDDWKK
ncbi:hypothetical protein [Mesorhizobium humile]|uniref:DUF1795 domain-containing protein n=1 Tax=Mesorhizobium humile TaxID=3072313 RepID=A0ABU4YJD7_9HYPH|nr:MULTISPECIES: hypothetical protein [unclassified Mesorhizobium]MDX8457274.1 hypothetical protein [Mesorhizobium sp. VK2D]MDX8487067.1 hypothetical protein [Mesorhizobium sp. VK2B]